MLKMKGRKGTLQDVLVSMIAVIAVMVVIFPVALLFLTQTAGPVQASSFCEISAGAKAKTKVAGAESPLIRELLCRTKYYRIDGKGIFKSRGPGREGEDSVAKFDPKKPDEAEQKIKRLFAEEMRVCWRDLGEGRIDPFGDYNGNSRCVPCAEIYFEKESLMKLLGKEKSKEKIEKFTEYMWETPIPSTQGRVTAAATGAAASDMPEEISYVEYLTEGAKGLKREDFANRDIDLTKHYSIAYRSDRIADPQNKATIAAFVAGAIAGFKGGCALGGVVGSVIPVAGTGVGCFAVGATGAAVAGAGAAILGGVLLHGTREPRILSSMYYDTYELPKYCEQMY